MTATSDTTPAPVLDETALDAIRALDDEGSDALIREILATYFASCPDLLTQMDDGLDAGNLDKVRIATHTLKSSSANLGAMQLAQLCKMAENAARAGDLASAKAQQGPIHEAYRIACAALTRFA